MGGCTFVHSRFGQYLKRKAYRDLNYVEQYYNLGPYFYDSDWLFFNMPEDADDIIKI